MRSRETKMSKRRVTRREFLKAAALAGAGLATAAAPTSLLGSAAPTPAAGQPRKGGVARWWYRAEPASYDPHQHRHAMLFGVSGLVFSNLVRNTWLDAYAVKPDLAESWETSPDAKMFTFHLRKGVKWHDGKPFTAEDVKYSLEKMADPRRAPEVATLFTALERVAVVDSYAVTAYLKRPQHSFLNFLTAGMAKILPKHIADANVDNKDRKFLVGTGPFRFKEHVRGVSNEVERNPEYYFAGLPYLDGVKIFQIADPTARAAAVCANRLDMAHPVIGIGTFEELEQLKACLPTGVYNFYPNGMPLVLIFNLRGNAAPWHDQRVRRAVSLVVDRDAMVKAGYGSPQMAQVGGFFALTNEVGLPIGEIEKFYGRDKPYADRVAEAKRLMADAGYANGFAVAMRVRAAHAQYKRMVEMVITQVAEIGIRATAREAVDAEHFERERKGDFEWSTDIISCVLGLPDESLGWVRSNTSVNLSGYSNPEVDTLYDQLGAATKEKRVELSRNIERLALKDAPYIIYAQPTFGLVWWPYVKGLDGPPGNQYPCMQNVDKMWLDK